jgi:murein L,D-transpeptidase YafK
VHQATGIEKEILAFIAFMVMLGCLDSAWLSSGAYAIPPGVHYGVAENMAALEVLRKPLRTKKKVVKTAKKRHVNQARAVVQPPGRFMMPLSTAFGTDYPPKSVTLIVIKQEKRLEVWAEGRDNVQRHIRDYPICAISGDSGPKLKRGDRQVPEGVYSIAYLNPNSKYHLSMKLNYPNTFDRTMAVSDGRTDLGGNIFIHGDCRSIGCIAMGDAAIEELYRLVRDTGPANALVIIAPWDLRKKYGDFAAKAGMPKWTPLLYENIRSSMARYGSEGYWQAAVH